MPARRGAPWLATFSRLELTAEEDEAAAYAVAFNECFVQGEPSPCAFFAGELARAGRTMEGRRFGEHGCRLEVLGCWVLANWYSQKALPAPTPDRVEQLLEHVCRYTIDPNERQKACSHVPGAKLDW